MINTHLILTLTLFTAYYMRRDFKKEKRGRGREIVGAIPGEERGKGQAFHVEPFAT